MRSGEKPLRFLWRSLAVSADSSRADNFCRHAKLSPYVGSRSVSGSSTIGIRVSRVSPSKLNGTTNSWLANCALEKLTALVYSATTNSTTIKRLIDPVTNFSALKANLLVTNSSRQPSISSSPSSPKPRRKFVGRKKNKFTGGGELSVPVSKAVVGIAVKDGFNLDKLCEKIQEKRLYEPMSLDEELEEEVLYARALYNPGQGVATRDVFFFADGAVVFWNMAESEHKAIFEMLADVTETEDPQDGRVDHIERDFLTINAAATENSTYVSKRGAVNLSPHLEVDELVFAKYAISNALAQSVKLGVWEEMLSVYIDSIQHIAEDLKMGRNPNLSQQDVLVKSGEFFALKHLINLDSDLLDVPDFYWDREELEKIYQKAFRYFNIGQRTTVMNERLAHCVELTEMMSSNLSHKHASRLETIIIWLIAVEVLIELFHLFQKYVIES